MISYIDIYIYTHYNIHIFGTQHIKSFANAHEINSYVRNHWGASLSVWCQEWWAACCALSGWVINGF